MKLISAFAGIVIIVTEPLDGNLVPFALYSGIVLFIVGLTRIPISYICKRCLIVLPFILMAALFYPLSVIMDGKDMSSGNLHLFLIPGTIIFSKAILAVLLLIILTSTERFHYLLLAMRKLKMPKISGAMSAVLYRYIFLLVDDALNTSRARESRTPGRLKVNRTKVYGNQVATIFIRSWDRSEIIYKSMLSRGFSGEYPGMQKLDMKPADVILSASFIALLLSVRLFV